MEKPYFVKDLQTNNIVEINDGNRHYFEKQVPIRSELVFLDQYEQLIGELELTEGETVSFAQEFLNEAIERDKKCDEREQKCTQWEDRLAEWEKSLNERELKLKKTK